MKTIRASRRRGTFLMRANSAQALKRLYIRMLCTSTIRGEAELVRRIFGQ